MESSHYRKIELQSPADFTYLYANAVALSRQKLDLHLPPSANPNDGPDPMRERVRELVDDFINQTFATASTSVSINGLDSSSAEFPFPASFTTPSETVEYEAYDTRLAARVTSLYAQLESLTTTVAQLRRDAPGRAARQYAEQLSKTIEQEDAQDDDEDEDEDEVVDEQAEMKQQDDDGAQSSTTDVDMPDADAQHLIPRVPRKRLRSTATKRWNLDIPLGTEQEAEQWRGGEIAEVYEDALRTLLRLQGETIPGDSTEPRSEVADGNALASTVGKAERAGRALEFVEKI